MNNQETVTGLIDLLNKPGLLYWANKIGLNGVSLKAYREQSSNAGIESHNQIELYFKKGIPFEGYEVLEKNLKGFKTIGVEQDVTNGIIKGRMDLVLEKKGVKYVIDFKSTDTIYLSTKLQLSTYKHLYGADKIGFISFDRLKLEEINIDTLKYFEMVKRLYQVKKLLNELNERL